MPQPDPAWEPQTPMPSPPVPLFWPLTAAEKPPGEVLEITPLTAVALAAVLSLVPFTPVAPPEATPNTPAPEPATKLLFIPTTPLPVPLSV